jgi:release factor glutamine methyltransferase
MDKTVLALARRAATVLHERAGLENSRLEAELLMAAVTGLSRLELYTKFDRPVDTEELDRFRVAVLRRLRREPVQYIVGEAPFRDLVLKVDRRVLIPRPETEILVGEVLSWAGGRPLRVLEVGTGSGAIALSLAREGNFAHLVATDASGEALEVASANATRLGLAGRIEFRRGVTWAAVFPGERFDIIVSNPPYVAESEREMLAPEVRDWEPASALFAGPRGVELLEVIAAGAADRLRPEGLLALEVGLGQADAVADRLRATGDFAAPSIRRDLTGRPRIVTAVRG